MRNLITWIQCFHQNNGHIYIYITDSFVILKSINWIYLQCSFIDYITTEKNMKKKHMNHPKNSSPIQFYYFIFIFIRKTNKTVFGLQRKRMWSNKISILGNEIDSTKNGWLEQAKKKLYALLENVLYCRYIIILILLCCSFQVSRNRFLWV